MINQKMLDMLLIIFNLQRFYANELRKNEYIVYGAYLEIELVGACYIYNAHKLYIEHLFVKKSINL